VIPGTVQPTLYKAGAEKIMATFRLAAEPEILDLSDEDCHRYLVKVRLISPSGIALGTGVGEASTNEEKYKWRRASCDEEWNETEDTHRRKKYGRKRGGGTYTVLQVRTNPPDLANTVLKMAKKRALIDAVLTVTAASDCFTQDIEDLPEGYDIEGNPDDGQQRGPEPPRERGKPQETQAQGRQEKPEQEQAPAATGPAKPGQLRVIRAKLEAAGLTEEQLASKFKGGIDALQMAQVNEALQWIAGGGK
jgi:hypothetical protein